VRVPAGCRLSLEQSIPPGQERRAFNAVNCLPFLDIWIHCSNSLAHLSICHTEISDRTIYGYTLDIIGINCAVIHKRSLQGPDVPGPSLLDPPPSSTMFTMPAFRVTVLLALTSLVSGASYTYRGCYSDSNTARALHEFVGRSSAMTVDTCLSMCANSNGGATTFAGLEFGGECCECHVLSLL
jgi:hypothetical protein